MAKGKQVGDFGLFQVDEAYESTEVGTRGRGSPLDPFLDQIKGNAGLHNREIGIARYSNAAAAKSQVHSQRARLGTEDASGWTFGVKYRKDTQQYAVTAKYNPAAITEAGKQKHEAELRERREKERVARIKRERDKAQRAQGSEGAEARANGSAGPETNEPVPGTGPGTVPQEPSEVPA